MDVIALVMRRNGRVTKNWVSKNALNSAAVVPPTADGGAEHPDAAFGNRSLGAARLRARILMSRSM